MGCIGTLIPGPVAATGGCAPFRDDGYACMYGYTDDVFNIAVWFMKGGTTDGDELQKLITEAIFEIFSLFKN